MFLIKYKLSKESGSFLRPAGAGYIITQSIIQLKLGLCFGCCAPWNPLWQRLTISPAPHCHLSLSLSSLPPLSFLPPFLDFPSRQHFRKEENWLTRYKYGQWYSKDFSVGLNDIHPMKTAQLLSASQACALAPESQIPYSPDLSCVSCRSSSTWLTAKACRRQWG